MRYTWDTEKHRRNLEKHNLAFEDAIRIFDGWTLEKEDDRFDYGEVRIYAIGLVNGVETSVIYTEREPEERRMIAAWKSQPNERKTYWKSINRSRKN